LIPCHTMHFEMLFDRPSKRRRMGNPARSTWMRLTGACILLAYLKLRTSSLRKHGTISRLFCSCGAGRTSARSVHSDHSRYRLDRNCRASVSKKAGCQMYSDHAIIFNKGGTYLCRVDFTGNRRLAIASDRAAVKRAKTFIAEGNPGEIYDPGSQAG